MMKKKLYNKPYWWLALAIVVFLVNQLPFLVDMRPVMYDEAWYGDTAYNLVHGRGFLNTVVGTRGNSNFLLPLMTAGTMLTLGCNLLAIRLTAVLCGLLTIVFLFLSMKQMKVEPKAQAIVFLFFVSATIYNTIFRFGRPECAALMCMSGGIWFYLRFKKTDSWLDMIGLSIFVFLSGCAHPYALLLFALLGASMLIEVIKNKSWSRGLQLLVLLAAAIASVLAVAYVSKIYNGEGENYISERISSKGILTAMPLYFKEAFFSRATLCVAPVLFVLLFETCFDRDNRTFAIVALIHFLIFPILFSTDLMMVGLGLDYVVLAATVLLAPFAGRMLEKKKKWIVITIVVYSLGCLGISYYFNYGVKYEKANSVMTEELQSVVPSKAKVFGPLRQWPMLMQTEYQSEHTVLPIEQMEAYDFLVLNTQDTSYYSSYNAFLPIDASKLQLVYEKQTKQYGTVQVYKVK